MDVAAIPVVESRNPASGEVVARIPCTPLAELSSIMSRARVAQTAWAARPVGHRCAQTRRLRDVLYARREEIVSCISRETGKPRVEALFGDLLIALDATDYYARNAAKLLRDERVSHHNLAIKSKSGSLLHEPYGVIAIISPWNYPLAIPMGQIVAAIVAGNAVILKPSELSPATGALIGDCFAAAQFPPDVLQVVHGRGDLGAALVEAKSDKIIFTGSVATGRRVAEACARLLIPSVLELGGKDAMIVLADADLESASSAAVWGGFTNGGQACLSVERIYVERALAERFIERCVAKTKLLKLGPPSDSDTEIGPLIRTEAVDRVEAQLREAVASGARIVAGGNRRPDLGPSFFEPTVVVDVRPAMALMRDETFGPVLAIAAVESAEEAVALANDSAFGLSASIWTSNVARGRKLAAQLHAGAVMINDVASYFGIAEAPHGGRRSSGWGRTHSRLGLAEMVQVKYLAVERLARWPKAWWYGYDSDVADRAGRFMNFLFAPRWMSRWRNAGGAARNLWRGHRI
jgi:acyl-CoA reductase-like NAD-dependent aldehyde dehydrogenase